MNINDFKYITTIAELGSYNAAAKALYMTQPSLTQRIKYIEQEYGITIFNRNHQGTTLTSEGKIFCSMPFGFWKMIGLCATE